MKTLSKGDTIPVVDINPLISSGTSVDKQKVVEQIYNAFTTWGFCQLIGHGVLRDSNDELFDKLFDTAEEFFAQPLPEKMELDVKTGGTAWRGYVPVGSEGTHGKVDRKEGIYFGPEHHEGHPNLGLPLYGKNQFPKNIPAMRESVLEYIARIEEVGKTVCDAMSSALGLEPRFIRDHFLQPEPVVFFRAWRYEPRQESDDDDVWGIGEHSDFGLLTFVNQRNPGLQVLSPQGQWVDVPVIKDALVCNVGDMLDMITGGRFISTRHRVLPPPSGTDRISFPLFFDFAWEANMIPLPLPSLPDAELAVAKERWAKTTFTSVSGQWWQYLAKKVQKVFPDLNLPDFEHNVSPSTRHITAIPLLTKPTPQ